MIMSTGMASMTEIEEAVRAAGEAGATQIALLKCVSAYPALPEEMNLRTISHMGEAFHVLTGLSDHTLGIAVPVAAVTLGPTSLGSILLSLDLSPVRTHPSRWNPANLK